ncbi:hypothetical protein ASE85_04770 [Sphingobium sp. Leaf26]|uniref:CHC2 zinc finger domain-containing protein n=1 Tax=Sphingobium sp. Leaf26 TaxID=1735693 RepID=UPI0006FB84A1|nr:CHC2 zinc finger domain-containing protein [Sphingobium sp. Leaf26]KQN04367.1 hypothetical protein ASE85_04770 [Sphingobium sp. Leaf26]
MRFTNYKSIASAGRNKFDLASIRAIPMRAVAIDLGFGLTAGGTGRCRIPGHEDRNPSFSIRSATNRFTCYACGENGDVIDLVMKMRDISFVDACEWLTGRHLGGASVRPEMRQRPADREAAAKQPPIVPAKTEHAAAPDHEAFEWLLLVSKLSSSGYDYLASRGFSAETIAHFRVGQIGDRGEAMKTAVARFGLERLRRCGLVCDGKFGNRFVFPAGYLLFPFIIDGNIAYLQARRPDSGTQWRWLCPNSLLPPVFNRSALSDSTATISICEGVTDVISAHELGIPAIGLVGANARLDDTTLDLLRGRNVAIFGDRDTAGSRFARRLVDRLAGMGVTAIPKRLPLGANDLNDHLRRIKGIAA